MEFQCIDWADSDIREDYTVEYLDKNGTKRTKESYRNKYAIRAYGRKQNGEAVCLQIMDFQPYFYIEVPDEVKAATAAASVFREITCKDSGINYYVGQSLDAVELVERKKYFFFNGGKTFKFLKLSFTNIRAYYAYRKYFETTTLRDIPTLRAIGIQADKYRFRLFESNITPLIRFFHAADIQPSGWLRVANATDDSNLDVRCAHVLTASFKDVAPAQFAGNAPFVFAAFDIECYSSRRDGDKRLFPSAKVARDAITQIGTTFHRFGEQACFYRHVVSLGKTGSAAAYDTEAYETEREVIMAWAALIGRMDPDGIFGFNNWGFDETYIKDRAEAGGFLDDFVAALSRNKDRPAEYVEKVLSSAAKGFNENRYFIGEGMVSFDIMKVLRADPTKNLASYKLNDVVAEYLRYPITKIVRSDATSTTFESSNLFYMMAGQYIRINYFDGIIDHNEYADGKKFRVATVDKAASQFTIEHQVNNEELKLSEFDYSSELKSSLARADKDYKVYWCQAKDDMPPQEIFERQDGGPDDRALIAKYCVQDCELCNLLVIALSIVSNFMGISNVCFVPFSYNFTRGQGILIHSLVLKICAQNGYVIEARGYNPSEEHVEGAIVLEPKPDIYLEPVPVLDFASLYPSQIIAEDLSSDTLVCSITYDNDGIMQTFEGDKNHVELPAYTYNTFQFDIYDEDGAKAGHKVCKYARGAERGILPKMEEKLLAARRDTRARMKHSTVACRDGRTFSGALTKIAGGDIRIKTDDGATHEIAASDVANVAERYSDFEKGILDGLQSAYKVICNSVYGQTVASSSKISDKNVGASITYMSRRALTTAKEIAERLFPGVKALYGDTDSLFLSVKDYLAARGQRTDIENMTLVEQQTYIQAAINFGQEISKAVTAQLRAPTDFQYEKTFFPFIIFRKKGYVANMYEATATKYKMKWMGVVLKRRDNPPFVKEVYYNIIKTIIKYLDIEKAKYIYRACVKDLLGGKIPPEKLVLSKSLSKEYANPTAIAHKVLADRMRARDSGTAPNVNERVPFVYVDAKAIRCTVADCTAKATKSKCIKCTAIFCPLHVGGHSCEPACRFCHTTGTGTSSALTLTPTGTTALSQCKTCTAYYCKADFAKHAGKCKKKLSQKLLQGDLLENPDYAREHGIPLDYRYYLEHQLATPIEQIFALKMENPASIIADLIVEDDHKRNGTRSIRSFFG